MIEVILRDKNNLISISVPGKAIIRGRTSQSQFFHTPLELLLSSLGLCVGGLINHYCRMNNLNPAIFEQITIESEESLFKITISHPKDLDPEHISRLGSEISLCNISKELKRDIAIIWSKNTISTAELLSRVKEKSCCGN